jgi:hypothetical protein
VVYFSQFSPTCRKNFNIYKGFLNGISVELSQNHAFLLTYWHITRIVAFARRAASRSVSGRANPKIQHGNKTWCTPVNIHAYLIHKIAKISLYFARRAASRFVSSRANSNSIESLKHSLMYSFCIDSTCIKLLQNIASNMYVF